MLRILIARRNTSVSCINLAQTVRATLFICFSLFAPVSACAQPSIHQTIARQVEQQALALLAEQYPATEIELSLSPVNPALQLPDCAQPLEISFPYSSQQRLTAKVSCAYPQTWSIFVTARIALWKQIVIARQAIPRGTQITAAMLGFSRENISRAGKDYFSEMELLIGQSARRAIAIDEAISSQALEPATLVHRGEEVRLEAIIGSARISTSAIALEDGKLNEQIRVQNKQSGKEVYGIVTGLRTLRSK